MSSLSSSLPPPPHQSAFKRTGSAAPTNRNEQITNGRRKLGQQQQHQRQPSLPKKNSNKKNTTMNGTASSSYLDHTFSSTSLVKSNLQNAAREARNLEKSLSLRQPNSSSLGGTTALISLLDSSVLSGRRSTSFNNNSNSNTLPSSVSPIANLSTTSARSLQMMTDGRSGTTPVFLQTILQDIADIKKKYPIVNVPDSVVKSIISTNKNNDSIIKPEEDDSGDSPLEIVTNNTEQAKENNTTSTSTSVSSPSYPVLLYEKRNGKRDNNNNTDSSSASLSQQLALERDQHRQKLDQVWRCAQGWKSRSKELEIHYKDFAQTILIKVEMERLVNQYEVQDRLEVLNEEQNLFSRSILQPFISSSLVMMNARKNSTAYELPSWQQQNNGVEQQNTSNQQQQQTIYRVKDSELLRSLKVAESRLAELGEPSVKMLTMGKNLVTY